MRRARRTDRLSFSGVLSHLGGLAVVSVVLGLLVGGLAIPFAGTLGLTARSAAERLQDLPSELSADPLAERSLMLDARGNVMASFYDEYRINVGLQQVSPVMRDAIVAIEDYRFYEHGALDLQGTLRAFIANEAGGEVVQGGSSITQQMVKQTLINQAETKEEELAAQAETYERKLNELRYAIAFEENYSKDWILERYLNIAYFGDGAYGIEAAAQHFFSTSASQLDAKQAALLAGLVKNPVGYDPIDNKRDARERRNVVLSVMAQRGVISEEESLELQEQALGLRVSDVPNGCLYSTAPFFCDYAYNYLISDPSLGETEAERRRLLQQGGLTIQTTMDPRMQQAADDAVEQSVYPTDQAIGALATVKPDTGEVKALAQSRPMGRDEEAGETFLNYTVDSEYGDSAGFQPGSTFKAFVLAAAIEQGVPLRTSIESPQTLEIPMQEFQTCGGPYTSTDTWEVSNSTGSGTYDLYSGTQQSVNTFFAQLELQTGLCAPYQLAKDTGVTLTNPDIERVPSFTLGVADVSPLEMSSAYGVFAAGGMACERRPVLEVRGPDGAMVSAFDQSCERVMEQGTADAVADIMKGVQEPGGFGYGAGLSLSQESAGKTGTTQSNRAVWFVGYTPNLSTASMIAGANQDGEPQTLNGNYVGGSYISSASGSGTAGPQWKLAMGVIDDFLPDAEFREPGEEVVNGDQDAVPSVAGSSISEAQATLEAAGFTPVVGSYVDSDYTAGTAAGTFPGAGTEAGAGSTVTIYLSDGTAYVEPDDGEG
ncbi:penicillin-binding protein [Nocardioidaceae bacterium]|nr:penicillin-binding protein [Nocardioidaceae bacterium]